VRYKIEEAASLVKMHRYGGQNSWWAASNVEGMLKLQCKRGARTLRYEALREMRFHAIPNLEKHAHPPCNNPAADPEKSPSQVHNLCASFADVFSTNISEHSPLRNLM
jgi:hypothetical protein